MVRTQLCMLNANDIKHVEGRKGAKMREEFIVFDTIKVGLRAGLGIETGIRQADSTW